MAIITLLTDFGDKDHYVAAVKGKILSFAPSAQLIDITHQIPLSDISAAAFTLGSVYKDFPAGTIHIAGVQQQLHNQSEKMLAAKLDDHFFLLPDNGLLSLISNNEPVQKVNLLQNTSKRAFVVKDVLAPAAAKLAAGVNITDLGEPAVDIRRLVRRAIRATMKQISGHVIRVDNYGNLITNIQQLDFDIISGKVPDFTIIFGRERHSRVHHEYSSVEAGEIFIIFNSLGLMEIGINQGNAEQLLGLTYDSPVMINFNQTEK